MPVKPGHDALWDIDAPMCSGGGASVAACVRMDELRTGSVVGAPPGIMHEVSTFMIHDGEVDFRRWVVEGRALRIGRVERRFGDAPQAQPQSRHSWQIRRSGGNEEAAYELPIIIHSQRLFDRGDHE